MVLRTFQALHLLLQRRQRGLRLTDVAGLQGIADLAWRLRKRTAVLIGLRLRKRRVGALRGGGMLLEEETGFIAMTRLRQDRLILNGIASPVPSVLLAVDLQMVNEKLCASIAGFYLCASMPGRCAEKQRQRAGNAARRYRGAVKSCYGKSAILYEKFIRIR